jgi:hypothetical protein
MNTQIAVLRMVWAATAALVIFLVVHTALEAFSRTATTLVGT